MEPVGVNEQQGPQQQKGHIDHHQHHAEGQHVLLGVAQAAAGEVFLHHILVEARHANGDEHAPQERFEQVVLVGQGIEVPDAAVVFERI